MGGLEDHKVSEIVSGNDQRVTHLRTSVILIVISALQMEIVLHCLGKEAWSGQHPAIGGSVKIRAYL